MKLQISMKKNEEKQTHLKHSVLFCDMVKYFPGSSSFSKFSLLMSFQDFNYYLYADDSQIYPVLVTSFDLGLISPLAFWTFPT